MTQKAPESEKTKERKSILRAEKAREKAAELGDAAGVKKALGDLSELRVFFVDLRDDRGRTPLMAAAMSGSEESVRALLNACGVNARDVNEATALMMAAERGFRRRPFACGGVSGKIGRIPCGKCIQSDPLAIGHRSKS